MVSATSTDTIPGRERASVGELVGALLAWTVFSAWAALVGLFYTAAGGSAPTTNRGIVIFLIVVASPLLVAGVWSWIELWLLGRTRLWVLPLFLVPGVAFWPLLLLLGWPGVRRAVVPRPAPREETHGVPRWLGVPRPTFPFAVLFWVSVLGIWPLVLLLVPAVRRAVIPRRSHEVPQPAL